ncbi:MAG: RHS repeat-associated core domain-containing protein [Kiritimatiellae bacterium]|nr:RHS repeat-associated core domain-containing protein [Kiritimatiellia bacterium]
MSDPGDVLSLVSFTNVFSINDRPAYVASYQASNRMASLTSPEGRTRRVIYNANGRAERIELPGLYPIDVAYDVHGRLQQFAIGTGGVRRAFGFGYTTNGFWGALTNSLLQSYRLDSDPAGRVTNLLQPDAKTIGLRYDKSSNLSGVTPPDKAEHQMDYNNVGLLGRYSAPCWAGVDTNLLLTWNARRQVTSIRLPGGATITNQYNAAGQVSQVRWPENRIAVAYANGHPISIVATSGPSLALGWDGSLLTNVTWGGSVTGRVGYTWSPDLRLSRITLNGDGIGYGYDFDLLLTNAGQLRLNRDAASGFVTNTVLGEVSDMRQISKFGELQASASDFGGTNLLSFDYGYDAMWRMTSRVERIQNQTNLYIYSYDAAGRLIEVHTNGSLRAKYQYDANGNRTNAILSGSSLVGHYDAQDRLLGYGATTYQYDDRGTLTNKSVGGVGTAYRYDARGSLLAVSSTVSVIRYSVDPLGRRIAKSVNGTTVQRLVYQDFLKPIAELNADGSVKSRFVYATRVNVPDYMVRSGTTYRIITDHLGSVRLVVDAQTGAVAQQMDYDEWGNVLQDTNPGFQPFGFAGGLYDPDTGLTRFGYRDYAPMTGRWLAKDPILFEGGQANLYLYCHGDPINYIDPNGLLWQGIVSALGGIVAGGGAAIGSLPLVIGGGAVLVIFGIWELLTVPDQIDDVVDNWRDGPVADHLIEVNDLINFEPYPLVTSTPRLK